MIKILSNEPKAIKFGDIVNGNTFTDNMGNIYMKIRPVYRLEPTYVGDGKYSTKETGYDCVSLNDGTFKSFADATPMFLVNCKVKWEYCDVEKLD